MALFIHLIFGQPASFVNAMKCQKSCSVENMESVKNGSSGRAAAAPTPGEALEATAHSKIVFFRQFALIGVSGKRL